jgi:hypothetical protein
MKLPHARRRILATVALACGVGVVLAVASVLSRVFFEQPPGRSAPGALRARPTVVATSAPVPSMFRVAAIEGRVEAQYGGQWSLVAAGDHLPIQSVIRTYPGARAILRRGGTEIDFRENVDTRLAELAAETARFELLRGGNVRAAVAEERQTVEIGAGDVATRNRGAARWVVSLGPRGRLDMAVSGGTVGLRSGGKEVAVHEGQESEAFPGAAPSEPRPIPPELLLSVFWPEPSATAAPVVRGKTRPSTHVRVNGETVPVGEDGRFQAPVPARVGDNPVSVQAEDIAGRRKTVESVIKREAPAPALENAKEDLWKP